MSFKMVFLSTDVLLWLLMLTFFVLLLRVRSSDPWRLAWRRIASTNLSVISMIILMVFLTIALLDSVHFQSQKNGGETISLFDTFTQHLTDSIEKSYSEPFALRLFSKETVIKNDGSVERIFPKLEHAGQHLTTENERGKDITVRLVKSGLITLGLFLTGFGLMMAIIRMRSKTSLRILWRNCFTPTGYFPWHVLLMTVFVLLFFIVSLWQLSMEYHVFGTDKVGNDVLYLTLKSIRTGIVIGTLTTLMMLPFAIGLGIMAGYFGGWIDDVIQYVYTTLSSVPGVLLIAASVLSLQIFINNHSDWFPSITQRADAKLLALCAILGITSWTSLCRLLRGETLKLRQIDYVLAARSLGTGHFGILFKHILPNVFHIVLIAVVLDFSALVLAEAVLSYVGVGVDPATISWGNMINSARLELAREPVVWWPLLAVFVFMFLLVLSANLFADAVRDGLDPR